MTTAGERDKIEFEGLLGGSKEQSDTPKASSLYRNFIIMSTAFSCNHGSVVSCLAYASAELGPTVGGYGSGALYVCYALTAFFLSKPLISMIGPKNGLLCGVGGYCIYVLGFLIALISPKIALPVFLIAACIGGIAGGLLWTAQGRYFAKNANLYAEARYLPVADANAKFAGIFAMSYLGWEMVLKVLATVIFLSTPKNATFIVFTTYTVIAVASFIAILKIDDLGENGTRDFSLVTIAKNSVSAVTLAATDMRLLFLLPFQIAFGFASSFVPFYILGSVIANSDSLGGTWVGLLSAIIVLSGALTAVPASWIATKLGKQIPMTIGGLCMAYAGAALFFQSDSQLGTWGSIVPFLIIYGIGRGTYENTNKAVVADYFGQTPEDSISAFASISFANGLAGSIGYFTFANLGRDNMATIVTASAATAIACYYVSSYFHYRSTR